jgi:hypothetical protein
MREQDRDIVERLHREAVQRHWEKEERQRAQVEAVFEQALQRQQEQDRQDQAFIEQQHRQFLESEAGMLSRPISSPSGIHYTELPEAEPEQPLAEEWNTYRREVGRWLAEGLEGRHVLIKGRDIIGFFDTLEAAQEAGGKQFPGGPFFIHPIRSEEPFLRIRGLNYPWPSSLSQ